MPTLTLSIVEIIVLMLGAIVLGITIHFFLTSQRSLKASLVPPGAKKNPDFNEWKLKYFNDIEIRDKELVSLREQLQESEENKNIFSIEAEEMRKLNKKLQAELETMRQASPAPHGVERVDYFEQLRQAQASLMEHNEKINQLLSNIDIIKETEEKQKEILRDNEELYGQIDQLKAVLAQKEQEIGNIKQKAHLSREMTSMLDNAYLEFNTLQEKMQKLESQVNSSKMINLEYEDLKEEHYKLRRDFEDQKIKLNAHTTENRELHEQLAETEEKLREANFQRQQLQKRVSYLEELNHDLQAVSDANKRLESQIKRIGELESMLNVIAEERDQLMRRQT
jgi:chromosome segregation ATPase